MLKFCLESDLSNFLGSNPIELGYEQLKRIHDYGHHEQTICLDLFTKERSESRID